jgi:hypothetical protein
MTKLVNDITQVIMERTEAEQSRDRLYELVLNHEDSLMNLGYSPVESEKDSNGCPKPIPGGRAAVAAAALDAAMNRIAELEASLISVTEQAERAMDYGREGFKHIDFLVNRLHSVGYEPYAVDQNGAPKRRKIESCGHHCCH